MANEFKVPELGESVESASVAKVLVSEGDQVKQDQPVVELETDKAVTEVPCDTSGTVETVHVKKGDEVEVGQLLLTLKSEADENGRADESEPESSQDEADTEEASDATKTDDSEDKHNQATEEEQDKKGTQQKKPETSDKNEKEEQDEEKDEEASDATKTDDSEDKHNQATEEEPDENDTQQKNAETSDKNEKTEQDEEKDEEAEPEPKQDDKQAEPSPSSSPDAAIPAAPSVRRFAREIGVDINDVVGSGPHGRISTDDVKALARESRQADKGGPSIDLPDFSQWGQTERKPMQKVRRLTAKAMSRAWSLAPQATQFGKADVSEIEQLRQRFKPDAEKAGGHLSLSVLVIKAVVGALKEFPHFNASVDGSSNEIVYKHYCHIGLAMDTEHGLLVPVIRDADRMNVIDLAVAMKTLTDKAREGKLGADEMGGGSMTITNAGALGGDCFIPIVNWPEVAILGVARTQVEPVFRDGEFKPRTLLPMSLSYDHRIIDGADGVRFMRRIIEALEDPVKMAWEG